MWASPLRRSRRFRYLDQLGLRLERGVEVARPEPFEVQGDIAVPGGPYSSDKLVAPRNCIGKVAGRELYSGEFAVVTHSQLAKTESTKTGLGHRDGLECRDGDRRAVRDARSKACS